MSRQKPFYEGKELMIEELYLGGMCAEEIKEELEIKESVRSIQRFIKKLGITRSDSDHRILSIIKGRMNYEHLSKEKKAKESRKAIGDTLRFEILSRDEFKCVLCGASPKNDGVALQIDHIVRPEDGGTNDSSNLRSLCYSCNVGRYFAERKTNNSIN